MIDNVAVGLVRDPEPTCVAGVFPVAIEIWAEIAAGIGLPDVTPDGMIEPMAEGLEAACEVNEADLEIRVGLGERGLRPRGNREHQKCREGVTNETGAHDQRHGYPSATGQRDIVPHPACGNERCD